MATYPVKYLHSGMRGAPVLTGQAGTLVALLHAALVTGFGMVTALSASVAAGTATVQFNAGQSFDVGDIVVVAGATPDGLNGGARTHRQQHTHHPSPTTAPDGAASGTITVKAAPAAGIGRTAAPTRRYSAVQTRRPTDTTCAYWTPAPSSPA